MRVVCALGGNALLRRGEALSAENQRANARAACEALAPVALEHQLVISHGNGPQVGLLALQGSAYTAVDTYPLDILGAQTEGMIGYMLEQELGNALPFDRHIATLLTMIEVDRDDPAFGDPTKPIGPIYTKEESDRLAAEKGWAMKPDGSSFRRVVPSPLPRKTAISPTEDDAPPMMMSTIPSLLMSARLMIQPSAAGNGRSDLCVNVPSPLPSRTWAAKRALPST